MSCDHNLPLYNKGRLLARDNGHNSCRYCDMHGVMDEKKERKKLHTTLGSLVYKLCVFNLHFFITFTLQVSIVSKTNCNLM